ncbi:MAG: hypothetical protein IAE79_23045 [Anaerolinea sp.]|nr:hypothetical protein [Anaerolinea sp.]
MFDLQKSEHPCSDIERILFVLVEAVRGKRVDAGWETAVQRIDSAIV